MQPIGQRPPLEILHYVVGRSRIPADGEQLDDIAIGEEEGEFFDLAAQERPIEPAAMGVEFDRHAAAGIAFDGYPDFPIRPHSQKAFGFIAWHLSGGTPPLQAHLAGEQAFFALLNLGRIDTHGFQYSRERGKGEGGMMKDDAESRGIVTDRLISR